MIEFKKNSFEKKNIYFGKKKFFEKKISYYRTKPRSSKSMYLSKVQTAPHVLPANIIFIYQYIQLEV